MKKLISTISVFSLAFGVFTLQPAVAADPNYDTTGSYIFSFEYLGSNYEHDVNLTQTGGDLSGDGGSPVGANVYTWVIDSGTVSANDINFTAHYTATADATSPLTTMIVTGTIGLDGTMGGTWSDNYQGGSREGTWMSVSGTATPIESSSTIVVTGDTAAGENQPGWLFNRDLSTSTPFEFNNDQHSIGDGSLYVMPIGSTPADKFIGENFINTPVSNVDYISYDFMIGSGGDDGDAAQFYMNVYANFGESDDLKFYDCRYDVVPSVGSTAGFTTVTFDPTQAYPVTTRGSSPYTCPAVPADMDSLSAGSNIRAFALNVGDTSDSDLGLDGYLDNVIVKINTTTTTYDFEAAAPFDRHAMITSPTSGEVITDGSLELTAVLYDEDMDDTVQWAVREGTCAAGVGTVAGNVDGYSTPYDWDHMNFMSTIDVSSWTDGAYCFVFNPSESSGDTAIRETVEFTIDNSTTEEPNVPMTKDECKNGGWMTFEDMGFKNQGQCVSYVATRQHLQ